MSSIVVVPAHDEQATIAACLRALAAQTVGLQAFETIVVLDACTDATAEIVERLRRDLGLGLTLVDGPGAGAGAARRLGMDLAAGRLFELGRPDGLVATTDADSRPAPDWLERQLRHLRSGAPAVAGLIELDPLEYRALPPGVRRRRERDAATRLRRVRAQDPAAGHHHFAGASIGITAAAYRQAGGLQPLPALEDASFAERLTERQIPIVRPRDVRVHTSARVQGRVSRGLSVDLDVSLWLERRRYRAGQFELERLAAAKGQTTVTVIVPTKECAETIAQILAVTVGPAAAAGLVDELIVVDAGSRDGTGDRAAAAGARVLQQDDLCSELGPALGKGDAMWRAMAATAGELICFLDGDTRDPAPEHLIGLLGPLLTEPSLALVKGSFERSLDTGGAALAHEGGRVTELMARPLLNLHEPRLAGFSQPLAGEFSARRSLLEQVPFPVGYGVEIAVLIDALRRVGLDGLAECDLGRRQNRHQSLRALGEMAYAVLVAAERRRPGGSVTPAGGYLRPWDDGSMAAVPVLERPPLRTRAPAPA